MARRGRFILVGDWAPTAPEPTTTTRPLRVELELQPPGWSALWRSRPWLLGGSIHAEDLALGRPLQGSLALDKRLRVHYRFHFTDAQSRTLAFAGRQQLSLRGYPPQATMLTGQFIDQAQRPRGDVRLRFDLRRELLPLLRTLFSSQSAS